jgi:type VI secretion system protein ImpJ
MSIPNPHLRILWHEGMLLSPQHFQQESSRVDALLAWQMLSANPQSWGVKDFEIDTNLLANGILRLNKFEAIFPDGTSVIYPSNLSDQLTLELKLADFEDELSLADLEVFVAIALNTSLNTPGQTSRFRSVDCAPVSDEVSDALPVDLPRMEHRIELIAGNVPSPLYISMRLLTISKENEVYKLGSVLPPLLSLTPTHPIWIRTLNVVTQMRTKAVFLAKLTSSPSSRLEDRLEALELRNKLSSLVLPLAKLQGMLASNHISPFLLYWTICEQLGPLSMLKPGAVPMNPPRWMHTDPASCFDTVLSEIEELVLEVSQDWRAIVFGFDGKVFSIDGEFLPKTNRFYVGLRGQSEEELMKWMSGAVIGSQTIWTSLTDRRILGAARKKVEQVEELGLRTSSGYSIYAVELSENFVVFNQPLLISNANESKLSPRPREIVLFEKSN